MSLFFYFSICETYCTLSVNAVYLYEDKIILTFNYKDGSKTITLAEVEGSDLSVLGAPEKTAGHSHFWVYAMRFFLLPKLRICQ